MQIDHNVYTEPQFAWGLGAKLLIYQTRSIGVGVDVKYFQSSQQPAYFVSEGYTFNVASKQTLKYIEEQAALGLSWKGSLISPYLYATYIYSKIDPQPMTVVVRMPIYDGYGQSVSSSIIDRRRWGMAFGATILGGKSGSVTIESRFFNQNAINISGEIRL
jgi:hypothetical protein